MTHIEYEAWTAEMKRNAGNWKVDPVHDGTAQDLLIYCARREDPTSGSYIQVRGGTASAGTYEDAIPHLGEASFTSCWTHKYESYNAAIARVLENAGMNVLMAVVFGESPYRSVA